MTDLSYSINFEPSKYIDDGAFDRFYRPDLSDALGAIAEETYVHNPTNALIRLASDDDEPVKMSPEEAQDKYGIGNLRFERPVSEARAKDLYDMKLAEMRRQTTLANVPTGIGGEAAKLGVGFLVSMTDPLNIASAFLPTTAIRGMSAMRGVAAPSFITGKGGTIGSRILGGAAEGAVGAAMIEPLPYFAAQKDQLDYTLADSMMNIAFGTVLGGGLHGIGKYLENRKESAISKSIDKFNDEQKKGLLQSAIADAIEDSAIKNHGKVIKREILKDIPFHVGEHYAARVLSEAPQAPVFSLGNIDGLRYKNYSSISNQDMRWIEGVVNDLDKSQRGGLTFIDRDFQGGTRDVVATPSTSPAWFQKYNKEGGGLTKQKVGNVLNKLKNKEPLGKDEGRIAELLVSEGRALREANARQIVDFRDGRAASHRETVEAEIDEIYRRELEAMDEGANFSRSIQDDLFADMESLAQVEAYQPKKLMRSDELKAEADEVLNRLRQDMEATGTAEKYNDLLDAADREIANAEAEALGWRSLGACMVRKG